MWHYRTMPSPALIPRADPRKPRSQVHTRTGSKWNLWNYISRYHWQSALDGLPEKFFQYIDPRKPLKPPSHTILQTGVQQQAHQYSMGIPLTTYLQCLLFRDSRKIPLSGRGPNYGKWNRDYYHQVGMNPRSRTIILIYYRTSTQMCCLTIAQFTWVRNQWPIVGKWFFSTV